MNYIFKSNISEKDYDKFVKSFPSSSFMQTSNWAKVKDNWEHDFVGMYNGEKLVCAAMILKRNLILNKKLFYIPRGFLINYDDEKLLKEFVSNIKSYSKKNGAIVVKTDPFVCFQQENVQNIKKNKNVDSRKDFTVGADKIDKSLRLLGFKHGGYKKEVNAYFQPRYTMVIPLKDMNGKTYDKVKLRRTFPKNTRNYIGDYHKERGVEFSYSTDIKDVKELVRILNYTSERQHVSLRNEDYFIKMMESFPKDTVLFFAKVDINKYIDFIKKDMETNIDKIEFCEKQLLEAEALKKEYGDIITAGASIVMLPPCKNGIKVASFLYAGTDVKVLPSLKITNGLMYYRLCYCLDKVYDYCDLGGIDGNLEDHLSIFKSKFNPEVLELIGEYDLIINKFLFYSFTFLIKILKFIRMKRAKKR